MKASGRNAKRKIARKKDGIDIRYSFLEGCSLTKHLRINIRTATLGEDEKIAGGAPQLKNRHRTFRAVGLEKERKTLKPTASKKDEEIDLAPTILEITDQAQANSFLAEMPPLNHGDLRLSKTLSRKEHQIRKQLIRERQLLRRLEEKERERLEQGEWSNTRTTMLGKYTRIGRRAPLSKKGHTTNPGVLRKQGKTGAPSAMLKSNKKAEAELLADLELTELIFSVSYDDEVRLIGWLDLFGSWEGKRRKRLEEIPW